MRLPYPSLLLASVLALFGWPTSTQAQALSAEARQPIEDGLARLNAAIAALPTSGNDQRANDDVRVFAKAVEWILRHDEFFKPDYVQRALKVIERGLARAADLAGGKAPWQTATGTASILAYHSAVDESLQPFLVTLPPEYGQEPGKRWPVHVVLHGRDGGLNEVSFISGQDGKPAPKDLAWIQLDLFGRTNNAYRWSGETDVFEGLAAVKQRYRVDDLRVVLRGFSMGGAGAWHLGVHHPSQWCSVGPGAGFVDFYHYQKRDQRLPFYQHEALHIYDALDYALNAADVPICTYGGEKDPQLAASTLMHDAAEKLGVSIKVLVGPGMGHKFHPDSFQEYMAFLLEHQRQGREPYPGSGKLRFVTWTPKYNRCDWLAIEELIEQYRPARVEAAIDEKTGMLKLKTENVAVLQLARDLAEQVDIDGSVLELSNAAEGLLPGVYYESFDNAWHTIGYQSSLNFPKNLDLRKRHDLQGPIDDAFMGPFVCVRGTGAAWSPAHAAYTDWVWQRFAAEFDKWFRGRVPIVNDSDVTPELMESKSLILFGDPGSNSVLAQLLPRLPLKWTRDSFTINDRAYDPAHYAAALIYPNPQAPRRYVVLNSGHTFHEADFKNSNAWLFPRLGDVAVQKFEPLAAGGYQETTEWADFFNNSWRLPSGLAPRPGQ